MSAKRDPDAGSSEPNALSLSAFARGVAHEIANPLNAISMHAELAKSLLARGNSERAMQLLDDIATECARCARLLRGLRRFGSSTRGGVRVRVRASAIVDAVLQLVREEADRKLPSIAVRIETNGELEVEREALERAVACLVQNACDAAATSVEVTLRTDSDHLLIEVRDDGGGIAENLRDKVVEPFFSTRHGEGNAGLGLTLAADIAQRHGGDLIFIPVSGTGTCVQLRLPHTQSQAAGETQ